MSAKNGKKMGLGLKILLGILGLIVVAVAGVFIYFQVNKEKITDAMFDSARNIEDYVGQQMPAFDVEQPDGTHLTKDGLLDGKDVMAVVLYASWCGPCEKEFPEMDSVYQKYQDKMSMVGIDVDGLDQMKDVEEYAQNHNLSFPLAYGVDNETLDFVKTSSYPTTLLVDRNGTICLWRVGSMHSAEDFEKLVTLFMGDDYTEKHPAYYSFYAYGHDKGIAGVEFSVTTPNGVETYTTDEEGGCYVVYDERADMSVKVLSVPDGVQIVDNGETTTGMISTMVRLPVR
ncbi:MAG: TlpA disulfide reductase family protein [Atopobiaceae bacterium]|nr:TlpA disulfide reductase family protein [Atopobiaceae bacterium]